jgi:hypothetical protein
MKTLLLGMTHGGDIPCGAAAWGEPSSAHSNRAGGGSLPPISVSRCQRQSVQASLMTRAILIAISIALIAGGLYLIIAELMWATSIDIKFVLTVIAGVASVTLGSTLLFVEKVFW